MAGESTATVKRSIAQGGITVGNDQFTVAGDTPKPFQKQIPASMVDAEIDWAIADLDTIQAVGFEADKDCDVYTNAIHTGSFPTDGDHLVLKANRGLVWVRGVDDDDALFLKQAVTKLYITTGAEATNFRIVCPTDGTPVI